MFFRRNKHDVREDDLSAYVDSELSSSARERVESHLETCDSCRQTIAELQSVRQAVQELPRAAAPRSFVLRQADVTPEPAAPAGLFGSLTPLLGGVAAIALVAFVVLAGVDVTSQNDDVGLISGERSAFSTSAAEEAPAADVVPQGDAAIPPSAADADDGTAQDGDTENGAMLGFAPDDEPLPDEGARGNEAELRFEGRDVAGTDDSDDTGLRIAQAVAAGVAVVAGASALIVWWRRRAAPA